MKIRNEWQYRHAKAQAKNFADVLANFDESPKAHPGVHPRLIRAQKETVASELEVLQEEIKKYERLRRKKSGLNPIPVNEWSERIRNKRK